MTASAPQHCLPIRVYYEDTDLAGIVYYANYLRYIERARSEWLRDLGLDQRDLRAQSGMLFVVRRIEADYHRPAVFDDLLEVQTRCLAVGGARIMLEQDVTRAQTVLFASRITMACIDGAGMPARVPPQWRANMQEGGQR